ncbi:hypothetical protein B0H21DRAFT_826774 [Amylocystis lapponica]|nr:hypothetical protein B0H21DRAFT_826774 [Amylocystis lapponica]
MPLEPSSIHVRHYMVVKGSTIEAALETLETSSPSTRDNNGLKSPPHPPPKSFMRTEPPPPEDSVSTKPRPRKDFEVFAAVLNRSFTVQGWSASSWSSVTAFPAPSAVQSPPAVFEPEMAPPRAVFVPKDPIALGTLRMVGIELVLLTEVPKLRNGGSAQWGVHEGSLHRMPANGVPESDLTKSWADPPRRRHALRRQCPRAGLLVRDVADAICALTVDLHAMMAIGDPGSISHNIQAHTTHPPGGVSLIDCPHDNRKDVADKMIIVDMLAYALDMPAPAPRDSNTHPNLPQHRPSRDGTRPSAFTDHPRAAQDRAAANVHAPHPVRYRSQAQVHASFDPPPSLLA